MRFKSPGGNLAWWTPLMLFALGFVGYFSFIDGNPVWPLYAVFFILVSLLWFDIKWAATVLLFFLALLVPVSAFLIYKDFSSRNVIKFIMQLSLLYDLWEYRKRDDHEDEYWDEDEDYESEDWEESNSEDEEDRFTIE